MSFPESETFRVEAAAAASVCTPATDVLKSVALAKLASPAANLLCARFPPLTVICRVSAAAPPVSVAVAPLRVMV